MRDGYGVPLFERVKRIVFGEAKDPFDSSVFKKISLIAVFAWIGLGADGLSSSCYGPQEAFLALRGHPFLVLAVAAATALTVFIISTSYSQIIALFPSGGGGYVVASKLLSPSAGVVAGSALLIDYVLTISISVAAGADAVFSFLPAHSHPYRLAFGAFGIVLLTLLNLRGVKESVTALLPLFAVFALTHAGGIAYGLLANAGKFSGTAAAVAADAHRTYAGLGLAGMLLLFLRAYSMGAGTYTGIEAVSNGVSAFREPKAETARRTMLYMMVSLAVVVCGVMLLYVLLGVRPRSGKTLNAVLFGRIFGHGGWGQALLFLTLVSEAAILFVAAQAGFLDGPRVIASMAADRWLPARFTFLSDRLVIKNGIMLMGGAALAVFLLSKGSVAFLVVLYSINVFITFVLSQLGMVRHWHNVRGTEPAWRRKMAVNGMGLALSFTILVSVVVMKFHEGGWITLFVTAALIAAVAGIRSHYRRVARLLRALDDLSHVDIMLQFSGDGRPAYEDGPEPEFDPRKHTAVILVNGFNGLGLHTLCNVLKMFNGVFRNFVFVQVGIVDVDAFRSAEDIERLRSRIREDVHRYVDLMRSRGYYARGVELAGVDVVGEVVKALPGIMERYPSSVFFGGQLVFPEGGLFHRWLHNYTVFALQKKFYQYGIPLMLVPVRLRYARGARYDTGDLFGPLAPGVMPGIDGNVQSGAQVF